MDTKVITISFSGGEISPEAYARLDLDGYKTGAALCSNFITTPQGSARSRPGFQFCNQVKFRNNTAVLLPFIYSQNAAFALEFGPNYIRVFKEGQLVRHDLNNITSATAANPVVVTYTGPNIFYNDNWVFMTDLNGLPDANNRFFIVKNVNTSAKTFQLYTLENTPYSGVGQPPATSGKAQKVFELYSPYTTDDLYYLRYTQAGTLMTITHPNHPVRTLRYVDDTNWVLDTLSFSPSIAAPTGVTATATGSGTITYTYCVTAVNADNEESVASASASVNNNLNTSGNFNRVTWNNVTGATRYRVYKALNGIFGLMGEASDGSTGFRDDNIRPEFDIAPPTWDNPFNSANNYPTAVSYFEGRKWFGGTKNSPQTLWATQPGTINNLSRSVPPKDDDGLRFRLISRTANFIQHIVPLRDLLLLTSTGEWLITAAGQEVITPTSVAAKQIGYVGASWVQPIIAVSSVIYPQAGGGRVRELVLSGYDQYGAADYSTNDLSILAQHLFDGYTIISCALSQTPHQIGWFVRDDGVLLGLTYTPEHRKIGWHQHVTDGAFEAVTSIPEGDSDYLYAVVRRQIGFQTVRYIERMRVDSIGFSLEDSFCVDSGLSYYGTPAQTFRGLQHLNGKTVVALADGAVTPPMVVTNGQVTLPEPASIVHIGLPYTCALRTLPLAVEEQAFGFTDIGSITDVWLRVHASSSIFAGPSANRLREYKQRTTEPYGQPPGLVTGIVHVPTDAFLSYDKQVHIEQRAPLPLTVLSVTARVVT